MVFSASSVVVFLFINFKTSLLPDSRPKKTFRHPASCHSAISDDVMRSTRDRQNHFMSIFSDIIRRQNARVYAGSRQKQSSAIQSPVYPQLLISLISSNT